jgi:MFS family permease
MNAAIGLSPSAYGFGAGVFFFGYTAFEVPSNLWLYRVGARRWIARIAIAWGLVSAATMFVQGPWSFYALRLLLGLAEAGFFPGVIYYLTQWIPAHERARTIASFMTAPLLAGMIGGPVSGALLSLDGSWGLQGWQWLFLLEGLPATVLGIAALAVLTESPDRARWLTEEERAALTAQLQREEQAKKAASAVQVMGSTRVWLRRSCTSPCRWGRCSSRSSCRRSSRRRTGARASKSGCSARFRTWPASWRCWAPGGTRIARESVAGTWQAGRWSAARG